jgi:SAM-dependent methyltransferase
MPVLEQKALSVCKGRVLDAGAGAGSHSLILKEMGHDVTSLDNSVLACEVMKSRGLKNVLQQDLFSYSGEKYDTILMLMNGIGLTGTIDGLKNFLSKLPHLLAENGRLVFDSTNIIYLFEDSDGSILLNLNSNYYGEIEFSLEYNDFIGLPFNWLYVDFETLQDICEQMNLKLELLEEGPNLSFLAAISLL